MDGEIVCFPSTQMAFIWPRLNPQTHNIPFQGHPKMRNYALVSSSSCWWWWWHPLRIDDLRMNSRSYAPHTSSMKGRPSLMEGETRHLYDAPAKSVSMLLKLSHILRPAQETSHHSLLVLPVVITAHFGNLCPAWHPVPWSQLFTFETQPTSWKNKGLDWNQN